MVTGLLFWLYTFKVYVILPTVVKTVSKIIVSVENVKLPGPPSVKKSRLQAVKEAPINKSKIILFSIVDNSETKKRINSIYNNAGVIKIVLLKKKESGFVYSR